MRTEDEIREYADKIISELATNNTLNPDAVCGFEICLNTLKWVLGEIKLPSEHQ